MTRKRRRASGATFGRGFEGEFDSFEGEYRRCFVGGCEVRVWGAESGRGLGSALVGQLRSVVGRIGAACPIALMPDHHAGVGGVIGSVIASKDTVLPDLIGGDCGCGVAALKLQRDGAEQPAVELLEEVRRGIFRGLERRVPAGKACHPDVAPAVEQLSLWSELMEFPGMSKRHLWKLQRQLGTLGGGNHFLECAFGEEGSIWLLVHSGSRYLGGLLAETFRGAQFRRGEPDFEGFFAAQELALRYARASRAMMLRTALTIVNECCGENLQPAEEIDLVHNFVELREQDGAPLVLHRKGACVAEVEQPGIIPGSMAAGSYLVRGRGNPDSYWSSSHGAGRALSRRDAFEQLSWKQVQRQMEGIVWAGSERLKDEAPQAYKPLDAVMKSQRSLVAIREHLAPFIVLKGEN